MGDIGKVEDQDEGGSANGIAAHKFVRQVHHENSKRVTTAGFGLQSRCLPHHTLPANPGYSFLFMSLTTKLPIIHAYAVASGEFII